MIQIKVEKQNVNDDEVIISSHKKNDLDSVNKDEIIIELETSKVNVEITSPANGLIKYTKNIGDNVKIGDTIVTSGYSNIFPQDIKIGRIAKYEQEANTNFLNISESFLIICIILPRSSTICFKGVILTS